MLILNNNLLGMPSLVLGIKRSSKFSIFNDIGTKTLKKFLTSPLLKKSVTGVASPRSIES